MPRAVLMIADIGGYTRFMKIHRINLAHAQYTIAQLLEAVIDATPSRFKLAKLEGDAAFFYAEVPDNDDGQLAKLGAVVADIRRAFLERRQELQIDRMCSCDGCVNSGELNIKFVSHVGEIAFQKVKRLKEVAGVDVIHVHRLLKNSVPVPEYVLMSEPVYAKVDEAFRTHATSLEEHLEGLGDSRSFYVNLASMPQTLVKLEPSLVRRIFAWVRLTWRSTPYMLGLRKSCAGFRNMQGMLAAGSVATTEPQQHT